MQTFQVAVRLGFRAALRFGALVPLYAFLLGLGLIQTWPLLSAGGAALRNPWLNDLAAGNSDTIVNLFLNNSGAAARAAGWSFALVPIAMVSALAYAFCAGGMLSSYTATRPFWAGCRRFFWSFAALGALLLIMALVVVAIAVGVAFTTRAIMGLIVAGVGLALLNITGEYARAIGVVRDRRNPLVLLGQAIVFGVRHLGGVLLLALFGIVLYAVLSALLALINPALVTSPLIMFVQQAFIFGTVWLKGLRLAWAAQYVAASDQMSRTGGPVAAAPPALPAFNQR